MKTPRFIPAFGLRAHEVSVPGVVWRNGEPLLRQTKMRCLLVVSCERNGMPRAGTFFSLS